MMCVPAGENYKLEIADHHSHVSVHNTWDSREHHIKAEEMGTEQLRAISASSEVSTGAQHWQIFVLS